MRAIRQHELPVIESSEHVLIAHYHDPLPTMRFGVVTNKQYVATASNIMENSVTIKIVLNHDDDQDDAPWHVPQSNK